jgi:hypothetical protein
MLSKVRGFAQWANERLEWRRDPRSASAASARRVQDAFQTTAVPLYGLPASVACTRSISYGSEVPMWGPIPAGGEHIVRFGLTHLVRGSGKLEVYSEEERPIDILERSVLLVTRWGHLGEHMTIQRTCEVEVDRRPHDARLYLPWEAVDPTDWACLVPLPGVVLRVEAHAFPLSELRLVRVVDPNSYLAG